MQLRGGQKFCKREPGERPEPAKRYWLGKEEGEVSRDEGDLSGLRAGAQTLRESR